MKTILVYCDEMTQYDMGPSHPLRPERLRLTKELVNAYGLLDSRLVAPEPATREDILTVHTPTYVEAVEKLGEGRDIRGAWRYGFDRADNTPFPGMYDAACLYTGASLTAAETVMRGDADRAFSISGGLHHAMPDRASGFCVFNDPAIAVRRLQSKYERIAYVDIDAHHGDGVQAVFYRTDRVLTISMHESGDYLFPGTGRVNEIGEGEGTGYSVNIPLMPYAGDEDMVWAFEQVVPLLIESYDPQVIVAQLGVDAHFQDPLAHLQLTSEGFERLVKSILGFGKSLVALGGGGYNISTVARLWTLAFGLMKDTELPDEVPPQFTRRHHIQHLRDTERPRIAEERRRMTRNDAEEAVRSLKDLVFRHHGLPTQ